MVIFAQHGVFCWEIQDGFRIHPSVTSAVMAEVAVGWLSVSSYKCSSSSLLGFAYTVLVSRELGFYIEMASNRGGGSFQAS